MKKLLIGCAITMFAMPVFANPLITDAVQTIRTAQADHQRTQDNERRYYILSSVASYQALHGNVFFKNIKMDKSPVPMRPVPKAI